MSTHDLSGQAMDRVVGRPTHRAKWIGGAVALLAAGWGLASYWPMTGASRTAARDRIRLVAVQKGQFEDFVPMRGRVEPAKTVFLDAVEGGRIEKILVEDGDQVEVGTRLAELSNVQLQLDVMARESEVEEQLNNLRTLELNFERNRLDHARALVGIDYQITRLQRFLGRNTSLAENGTIPKAEVENARDELAYQQALREVTIKARDSDERMTKAQVAQLRASARRMERNLEVAQSNLDALLVSAPVAGTVTALSVEVGQSLQRGGRIARIDSPDQFKIVAEIDEFYLARVSPGLAAEAEIDGHAYTLRVGLVSPEVTQGFFKADLLFTDAQPPGLRRGQSLTLRLYLGDSAPALLIPTGAFLDRTGGNWIYALAPDGLTAVRRSIRTGRRNTDFVEVLNGLEEGDRVIVSNYSSFNDVEQLRLISKSQ